MKLKVDWKSLVLALWSAVKPVLLGAIGGGIVTVSSGCSGLAPTDKTQTMGVYALGIPGIAVITHSEQVADNAGQDKNTPVQVNPVTIKAK
jgi:hypothetical protein